MEDYSRNKKVKPEKQRRNIYYAFWSVCIYNVCIQLFKICYLALKLYSWKSLYDRYLPLEEALSLELESSQEMFSSQYRDRNLWGAWPYQ